MGNRSGTNTNEFFKNLANEMEKQGNRATQYPLFYVYEKEEFWVDNDADSDRVAFYDPNNTELTDEKEDEDGNIWKFDGNWNGEWKNEETGETLDYYDAEEKFGIRKLHLKTIDKPAVNVGPFFTEKEAKEHIRLNYYHYKEPFIYVNSAWRNPEMQEVMHKIFELAGKDIPSQYR